LWNGEETDMTADGERGAIRRRVVFSGRVQGVCFRMISQELSQGRGVVGYVRNLPDGTVELEAEGATSAVDGFLQAIQTHFSGNIAGADESVLEPSGDESEFQIRY
jgi:acylphosphatase